MDTTEPTRARHIATAIILAGFVASPVLSSRVQPNDYAGGRSRNLEERARRNESSVGVMFGELRTAMSDIMLIKTERYLHSGVAYVPHLTDQLLSVSASRERTEENQEDLGAHEGLEHEGHDLDECAEDSQCIEETIIRSAAEDFRGFIGVLHRKVKPWKEPGEGHQHTDGRELLPWFRVMTLSDPHYIPGYTIGSWWLKSRNPDEARAFVEEGIRDNPDAFQIHLVKGQILLSIARSMGSDMDRPDPALRAELRDAVDAFHRSAELALAQRPDQPDDPCATETWTAYMEEDAWGAARMSAMMEWRYGDPERGGALARAYQNALGEDETLSRLISR